MVPQLTLSFSLCFNGVKCQVSIEIKFPVMGGMSQPLIRINFATKLRFSFIAVYRLKAPSVTSRLPLGEVRSCHSKVTLAIWNHDAGPEAS